MKVSMDGAPYLRKIDLKVYKGYPELLKALEEMFKFKAGKYRFPPFYFLFNIYIYVFESKTKGTNFFFQVSIRRGKGIMDQNMYQHMKTKMEIGCWLEMFHGSKFFSRCY